ncbi:MAG TPA: hypothetical protein VE844_16015, partial [Gammaproteobacteria bacterium]|nr:hypothetical protein [Gammaproteobacteria bacterium]
PSSLGNPRLSTVGNATRYALSLIRIQTSALVLLLAGQSRRAVSRFVSQEAIAGNIFKVDYAVAQAGAAAADDGW